MIFALVYWCGSCLTKDDVYCTNLGLSQERSLRNDTDLMPYLRFSSCSVNRSGPLATLQVGTLVKRGGICYTSTHPELP